MKMITGMKCKKAQYIISNIEYSHLNGHQKEAFDTHLSHCEACNKYKVQWEMLVSTSPYNRFKEADPYFFTQLIAKIESQKFNPVKEAFSLKPALVGMLFIVPAIAGILLGMHFAKQQTDAVNIKIAQIEEINQMLNFQENTFEDDIFYARFFTE